MDLEENDPSQGRYPYLRFRRLEDATAGLFRAHIDTEFVVLTPDGVRQSMTLVKVTEKPAAKNIEQFSLIFHAPAAIGISDGNYALLHQELGSHYLFLVPIGSEHQSRRVYQACFSRVA
jgi:hypothetical protein